MAQRIRIAFLLFAVALACHGCMEQNVTLTIGADGGCVLTTELIMARSMVERQVEVMERVEQEQGGDGEKAQQKADAAAQQKTADAKLEEAVRKMFSEGAPYFAEQEAELKTVEIGKERVRVVLAGEFGSVDEMMDSFDVAVMPLLGYSGFSRIVFDQDDAQHLRITFSRPGDEEFDAQVIANQVKATLFKGTLKIVLPGKVLGSSLPETKENATWIAIDPAKEETLNALTKVLKSPAVITSEMAGLALDLPLDSGTAMDEEAKDAGADLPLREAGPGFEAEGLKTMLVSVYLFPEAKDYKISAPLYSPRDTGVLSITARLFAPQGREILSVQNARVTKAVDDKGRTVEAEKQKEGEEDYELARHGEQPSESVELSLRLRPPEPDAMAIEELTAEAEVVTFAGWSEQTLIGPKTDPDTAIDLSPLLPGAKMTIAKVRQDEGRGEMELKVTGPPAISRLGFRADVKGDLFVDSSAYDRDSRTRKGATVRTVVVNYYLRDPDGNQPQTVPDNISLRIRHPKDMRRERVTFKLEALDIF